MRKFKIEGIKFEIVNICDMHYKYRVDMLGENMWVTIGKCNTLASGKELAYNHVERQREYEEYNKKWEENYKKHIEELSKTKVCCSECGKELNLEEKINLENICIKCVRTHY